jgi:hypothetical protein
VAIDALCALEAAVQVEDTVQGRTILDRMSRYVGLSESSISSGRCFALYPDADLLAESRVVVLQRDEPLILVQQHYAKPLPTSRKPRCNEQHPRRKLCIALACYVGSR